VRPVLHLPVLPALAVEVHPSGDGSPLIHAAPSVPTHDVCVSDRVAAVIAERLFGHTTQSSTASGTLTVNYGQIVIVVVAALLAVKFLTMGPTRSCGWTPGGGADIGPISPSGCIPTVSDLWLTRRRAGSTNRL
jgi:hypothetical protein